MDDLEPPLIKPRAGKDDEPELAGELRQLVAEGRAWLAAELAYHKSRAALAGQGLKRLVGLAALALALVFFALMALVVGALLALSALVGAWAATGIVVAVLLGAAALAARSAAARWQRIAARLADTDQAP